MNSARLDKKMVKKTHEFQIIRGDFPIWANPHAGFPYLGRQSIAVAAAGDNRARRRRHCKLRPPVLAHSLLNRPGVLRVLARRRRPRPGQTGDKG